MMRKIQKLILSILMSVFALTVNASTTNDTYDWSRIMNAIIHVESRGVSHAYNPHGDCVGVLQIRPIVVKECNNSLRAQGSTKRFTLNDRYSAEKSKEMFILLQNHFNKEHSLEKAAICWKYGFYANWRNCPKDYYKKVMKNY